MKDGKTVTVSVSQCKSSPAPHLEVLLKGGLNQQEVGLVSRGIALSQCPLVPEPILIDLLRDTELFVNAEISSPSKE